MFQIKNGSVYLTKLDIEYKYSFFELNNYQLLSLSKLFSLLKDSDIIDNITTHLNIDHTENKIYIICNYSLAYLNTISEVLNNYNLNNMQRNNNQININQCNNNQLNNNIIQKSNNSNYILLKNFLNRLNMINNLNTKDYNILLKGIMPYFKNILSIKFNIDSYTYGNILNIPFIINIETSPNHLVFYTILPVEKKQIKIMPQHINRCTLKCQPTFHLYTPKSHFIYTFMISLKNNVGISLTGSKYKPWNICIYLPISKLTDTDTIPPHICDIIDPTLKKIQCIRYFTNKIHANFNNTKRNPVSNTFLNAELEYKKFEFFGTYHINPLMFETSINNMVKLIRCVNMLK